MISFNGEEISVNALLHTGFSGWLAINCQDLEGFNWSYIIEQKMRLAQGEINFDIYAGKVRFDGQEFNIPVHVGTEIHKVLLGRQWLKTRRLIVDIPAEILILEYSNI